MFVRYTYINPETGVVQNLSERYTKIGFPDGVVFEWAAESEYPTNLPSFYGTFPDGAEVPIGVLEVLTESAYNDRYSQEMNARRWKTVPKEVSARQAKLALIDKGYYNSILSYLEAIPGIDGVKAKISWESASVFHREDPLVVSLLATLGLSESEGDSLFQYAKTL